MQLFSQTSSAKWSWFWWGRLAWWHLSGSSQVKNEGFNRSRCQHDHERWSGEAGEGTCRYVLQFCKENCQEQQHQTGKFWIDYLRNVSLTVKLLNRVLKSLKV